MKILLIVQARVNSKRLKKKSVLPIYKKKSSLELIINKFSKIYKIIIATGPKEINKEVINIAKTKNIEFFSGSENNVRSRFEKIIIKEDADLIIRATADNPLVDLNLTKFLIEFIKKDKKISYVKFDERFIPTGSGVEIFEKKFFFKNIKKYNFNFAREHVTYHMMRSKKANLKIKPPKNYKKLLPIRITLDNLEDYHFIKYLYTKINKPDILKIDNYFKNIIN